MILIKNRAITHEFNIEERFQAGISLLGLEVKSIRNGQCNISEAYISHKKGELFLQNALISQYKFASVEKNYTPMRLRKLLLHKKEINKCIGKSQKKGMTIIPISMFLNKRGLIKIEIAIAKGKKLFDKRRSEKEKEWTREKINAERI
ncbi:SsrA-binding protein SmpB [Candidatus Gromoviella agglomerans]|uniref:SsrA-binding protein SmpB n=1 Tax=Candidatus Gromoviella agglomerans TaxID=2806609 RepID=UPI001E370931|nr:SsrA-binding protein SmpB [Candidatus Gromoviella agglomerans]UFX98518.1 SsrA-binding protein [Candidatus Gromoviella agglomerans]